MRFAGGSALERVQGTGSAVGAEGTSQRASAGRGLANTDPGRPIECVCTCACVCVCVCV